MILSSDFSDERSRGFALLIVLWALVLLALLMTHLTASGRTELRIAGNLTANAAAEAAADGAVYEAVFRLNDPSRRGWAADGASRRIDFAGGTEVTVRIVDEAGKINPNIASPELLAALLRALNLDDGTATRLASAIADWRDPGDQPRPQGAKLPQYRAAGRDYGPPNAPFQRLDELGRVLGMTPDLLARIMPHLSLYTMTDPDAMAADPVVSAALALVRNPAQPPSAVAKSNALRTVSITALARTASGGAFTRQAVLRIGAVFEHGYAVLEWGG